MSGPEILLCWGCGGLPWARLQPGHHQRHRVGSLGSWIGLSSTGVRHGLDISRIMTGESPICLSTLIQAEQQWLPVAGWPGKVEVEVVAHASAGAAPAPPLPSLHDLSDGMAGWCVEQLGEPGVLAVPWAWRELPLAAQLLAPWAQRGWRFLALEQLVQRAMGSGCRVITSDGPYLRIHGPVAQVVMPAGLEAAGALAVANEVLPGILQQAGPTVASYWRELEQQRQQPLVRALLARKIMQAMRLGAHAISLGGADAPLFFEPSPGAPDALQNLHDHRFRVFLPRLPDLTWWTKAAEAGFLRSSEGRVMIFGLDWKAVATVEIEGPGSPWELPAFLERAGTHRRALRAHSLHEHADAGEPFEAWFPHWAPPAPAAPVAPPPDATHVPPPPPEPGATQVPELVLPPPEPQPPPPPDATHVPQPPPPPEASQDPVLPPPLPEPEPEPEPPPPPEPVQPPPLPEPEPAQGEEFTAEWERQRAPTLPPPPVLEPTSQPEEPTPQPARTEQPAASTDEPAPGIPTPQPPQAPPTPASPVSRAPVDPQQLTVRPPHRQESLRLIVDGEPMPRAGFVSTGRGPDGRSWYLVEDCPLRHGALVRVDFEPTWGET